MNRLFVDRPVTRMEIWKSIMAMTGSSNSEVSEMQRIIFRRIVRDAELLGEASLWYPHTLSEAKARAAGSDDPKPSPSTVDTASTPSGMQAGAVRNWEEQAGSIVSTST